MDDGREVIRRAGAGVVEVERGGRCHREVDVADRGHGITEREDAGFVVVRADPDMPVVAAENLLKLIGRYDGLALDSWTRAQFARARNNGRVASDKKIARFYARFNSWRGLVLWCDMTRHWLDPDHVANW